MAGKLIPKTRLEEFSEEERLQVCRLILETQFVSKAHKRFYRMNPEAHKYGEDTFRFYGKSPLYLDDCVILRKDWLKDFKRAGPSQLVDQFLLLTSNHREIQSRFHGTFPNNRGDNTSPSHSELVKLSNEGRAILKDIREILAVYGGDKKGEVKDPFQAFLEADGNIEEGKKAEALDELDRLDIKTSVQ